MLTKSAQMILAAMLSLTPPGKSVYSRTTIQICDAECQTRRVCEDSSMLCDRPKFDQDVFAIFVKKSLGINSDEMRLHSFTRTENYEEGLLRYGIITEAIRQVSSELAWGNSSKSCQDSCKNFANYDQCKLCISSHPWTGTSAQLALALVVVLHEESGYRKDVHTGVGIHSRGDCEWRDTTTHRPAVAFAKGAAPVAGSCRSVCLGQINIGTGVKFGYKAEDLVGEDFDSTKRCVIASAKTLANARKTCSGALSDYQGDWAQGMFGVYGTGDRCRPMVGTGGTLREADWPKKRAQKFWTLMKQTPGLNEKAKRVLGLGEGELTSVMDVPSSGLSGAVRTD